MGQMTKPTVSKH